MKPRTRYKGLARTATYLTLLAGVVLPTVSCKKAEEESGLPCRNRRIRLWLSAGMIMDATTQVVTAVPKAGEYCAPINHLLKMRSYGMFNLTIRIYNPKPETFDPSYKLPPVQRVD